MRRGLVGARCRADEGRREAPCEPDEQEADDVVCDWGGGRGDGDGDGDRDGGGHGGWIKMRGGGEKGRRCWWRRRRMEMTSRMRAGVCRSIRSLSRLSLL